MQRLISIRYMPYCIAALLSVLCSFWISGREMVINPDGICYVQSAAVMKQSIHVAMNLCGQAKWPFYSLLIAGFVNLTHLSYVTSAYFLNGFFSLLSVFAFMFIINFLADETASQKNKPLLISLGAAVILLAHEFNGVKTYIIRDHGFWAFYLCSVVLLLYFFRKHQVLYAYAWGLSLFAATLFRIEGAIFLFIMPWIAWLEFNQAKIARMRTFLLLNSITILAGILLGGYVLFSQSHLTGRLYEIQFQFLNGLMLVKQTFQLKAVELAHTVLGDAGARDAMPILLITLIIWYFFNVIANLSLIYSVLICYAWAKKLMVTHPITRFILWGYISINVLITAIFFGQNLFLSKRYLIALSLVLMLWVPFALYSLIQQWPQRKWPLFLAVFFIFISSLGGIFDFGYSKAYLRDAGQWLSNNVPITATLYSNDLQLMYYSNHFGDQLFVKSGEEANLQTLSHDQWKKYDYLALRLSQNELNSDANILHEIKVNPVRIFQNNRGDQVRIYRRSL